MNSIMIRIQFRRPEPTTTSTVLRVPEHINLALWSEAYILSRFAIADLLKMKITLNIVGE